MTPRASIIVPTRGGVSRLPYLFNALGAQTEQSWEMIVVIDGDIDGTEDLVEDVRDVLPVRPIVFPENRGRAAALNAGFDAARGEVLIRCDDDLRPDTGYVAAQLAHHSGDPVGVVGLVRNIYPATPYARAYGYARDERFRQDAYRVPGERRWRYWCGNVSTTRDTFDRVGAYDTGFRAYGWEDVDWGYRLHVAGIPVVFAPELETAHHIAATTTEVRVRRAFYSGAARLTFEAKHGGVSSEPVQQGLRAWDRLVALTARNDLTNLLHLARRLDKVLDKLPRKIAEKRVSLLVEAAAISGELHPEQVVNNV